MESFNFGAFDTNLGARIAAIPQEAQKQQTANMLQAMQVQGVMNQNELAQSQIRTARRAEEGQTLLGKAYGGLDFSGANAGGVPSQSPLAAMKQQIIKSLTASNRPDLIPSELAKLTEMEHKETVNRELIGKINQQKTVAQISEADRYRKALVNVSNYDSAAYWLRHQYNNLVLKDIISIVPFETALAEIPKDPVSLADWKNKNALGLEKYIEQNKPNITPRNTGTTTELLSTPGLGGAATVVPGSQATIQISPNTTATLKQQQEHFNSLSEFQKRQLADAGWTFDTDRGLAVNARLGISQPISTLMAPVEPQGSAGSGAPAATPTAPSAAPAGTSLLQLTPGMAPLSASQVPIPQTIVGARVPQAVQNVMNNDQLKILLKERDNQVFLGRVDPALDREIANLQGRPTSVASQTATQPAQRTGLGPKPEKPTESYFKELKGVINTNDAINNLKQMVSTFTPADMLNPARRAEIDTAHKTAVLLAKEMFNLGVLNGGDQKILEQVIPDPIAFSKGFVPIETIRKNLDAASNVASRMNATLSKVHKQPLVQLDTIKPNAPNTPPPPIQSFRRL